MKKAPNEALVGALLAAPNLPGRSHHLKSVGTRDVCEPPQEGRAAVIARIIQASNFASSVSADGTFL